MLMALVDHETHDDHIRRAGPPTVGMVLSRIYNAPAEAAAEARLPQIIL
jgi:hypothetical protein